jgi:hypothetical protein
VGDHPFVATLHYPDVDFDDLDRRFGDELVDRVCFHIAAFELAKTVSLGATSIDFGPFERFVDTAFAELWSTVVHEVWAQWRWERDLPAATAPALQVMSRGPVAEPATVAEGDRPFLAFCGGGKDSLVTHRLLDEVGVAFDSFVYASRAYGDLEAQVGLCFGLLDELAATPRRILSITDSLDEVTSGEMAELFGLDGPLLAAETPASLFEAIPLVLQHGYRYLVLGHEASADVGNLVWAATGEEVNHQWGKSVEAERLLAAYLRSVLVADLEFFSVLKPLHDVGIFGLLAEAPAAAVLRTHSCNVDKPWCRRCAKCTYVWLNYLAYLDHGAVAQVFGEDLFDVTDNVGHLDRLLGLTDHTPFECIGEVDESRLALAMCAARGLRGPVMDRYADLVTSTDGPAIAARYAAVDRGYSGLPASVRDAVLAQFDSSAVRLLAWIEATLG